MNLPEILRRVALGESFTIMEDDGSIFCTIRPADDGDGPPVVDPTSTTPTAKLVAV